MSWKQAPNAGRQATGKSFSVRSATTAQLNDGKILCNADYWDAATFLRQLGVMK
jgi:ketosteroid isomerase-like protein